MARISVVSHCKETAVDLDVALEGRGHEIRLVPDATARLQPAEHASTDLFVVDIDCDPPESVVQIRSLTESPATAPAPVLVAATAEFEPELALACAYGATGVLRKPFKRLVTAPDTERALAAAELAG